MSEAQSNTNAIFNNEDLLSVRSVVISGEMDLLIEKSLYKHFAQLSHDSIYYIKIHKGTHKEWFTGIKLGAKIIDEFPSFYLISIHDANGNYMYNTTLPKR